LRKLMIGYLVLVLSACTADDQSKNHNYERENEGRIVYKEPENEGVQLLILPDVTKEEIKNKTKEQLHSMGQSNKGAYYYVSSDEYVNLEIGTHVKVFWNGNQAESNPPQRRAEKIEVITKD